MCQHGLNPFQRVWRRVSIGHQPLTRTPGGASHRLARREPRARRHCKACAVGLVRRRGRNSSWPCNVEDVWYTWKSGRESDYSTPGAVGPEEHVEALSFYRSGHHWSRTWGWTGNAGGLLQEKQKRSGIPGTVMRRSEHKVWSTRVGSGASGDAVKGRGCSCLRTDIRASFSAARQRQSAELATAGESDNELPGKGHIRRVSLRRRLLLLSCSEVSFTCSGREY